MEATDIKTKRHVINASVVDDEKTKMEKYAKEAGDSPGGAGRPGGKTRKAEKPGPPGSGTAKGEEPRVQNYDSRPRWESGPKAGPGKEEQADRLTVGVPHRQRCLSALTPDHLQGREPASRGAHHSPGHEDTQKAPGAPEAGSKTSRGHLTLRACLLRRRMRTPARSPESQSQPQERHTHAQPGVARGEGAGAHAPR